MCTVFALCIPVKANFCMHTGLQSQHSKRPIYFDEMHIIISCPTAANCELHDAVAIEKKRKKEKTSAYACRPMYCIGYVGLRANIEVNMVIGM